MTACSSSATAIGYAADRIRLGHVDVALAGGAEGLTRLTYAGFGCLRATAPGDEPCRPFDAERKGLTLGEGAAVLVLEDYERARARGATILAVVAGWGITADAHHMTAPHPEGEGAARAMRMALDDAKLSADAIGYVNAHGTGTPHNDAAETLAIKRVLGARAPSVPVSSIKSMVGHTLGAAGAIEAVASVLSLARGFLPPTVHLRTPDPAFGLDYIPGAAREVERRGDLVELVRLRRQQHRPRLHARLAPDRCDRGDRGRQNLADVAFEAQRGHLVVIGRAAVDDDVRHAALQRRQRDRRRRMHRQRRAEREHQIAALRLGEARARSPRAAAPARS